MVKKYPKNSNELVSEFFSAHEFDCPCSKCQETLIDSELVERADALRKVLDTAVFITSGYRCAAHQALLRKEGCETAKGISQHELGKAIDVRTGKHTGKELAEAAKRAGFRAIGTGHSFIHVDLRSDRDRAWFYSY